ncbi:8-amino-7-oxononanoate synthase [Magnetococcus marinus MC-1]|uniref:Putative 8-amino-7-oxononanoate synthase n=1 Tax=Magnetococcus marinus (strain ATCC BAA-1437 / JCM 17883 / MC-1) TaxID=156889 RepID=BIOF_MAGMM|nr:8-amino-7-oxononanoate synthase [Magnetococcus marinus]A0L3L7.1 RecName: Full=Putative 8-amino-7-oxononanoate synthase; Short=AONS; AltName: Full=7-keto-8-amino-pelargonic acid synthase; Short=7-KAP synthase; AltName: Full=8-amino-7-ketopelargonate synthase [Magnetococcus marinus MC-1]ABK42560.1 8-amino-7-oxononanoate synthase [Magnetococcus marinus MC-1]
MEQPHLAYRAFCQSREAAGQWRQLHAVQPLPRGRVLRDGVELINFSSNNYMGLADHPLLKQRAMAWTEQWGTGAQASRLVCGDLEPFARIEARLVAGKGCEAALVLNAGYQANSSVIPALLDKRVLGGEPLVFSDRLNHASMHHGVQLAGVRQLRYRHGDLDHLERLLKRHAGEKVAKFILSETVFSMDGDRIDVGGLIALKQRYGAFLYLDEAHATGVLGPDGFGLAAAYPGQVDLVMGTFSKGLGGFGAYVTCSHALRAYLINRAGGFIYSTALPPGVLGAMDAALELLPQMGEVRARVLAGAQRVRAALRAAGLDTGNSSTPIIPVMVGDEQRTLALSEGLRAEGLLGIAIRPPTVPEGTSRLRLSLSAAHSDEDWSLLAAAVPRCLREING